MLSTITCPQKAKQAIYRPRRPEKTDLFKIIKKYYKTWKTQASKPVKGYVERVFEKYLACGNPVHGFACAHCTLCSMQFFIPFSCKTRGICPSCSTRTMVATAAHQIENIIPLVQMRQWVISFPFRIRMILLQPIHHQNILNIILNEIRSTILNNVSTLGFEIGAISFFQNFGSTLNVHPHFHIMITDGAFAKQEQTLKFLSATITQADIKRTEGRICSQVLHYLQKKKILTPDEVSKMLAKENTGFSLDGSVSIPSWDRCTLERLLKYCGRPSFSSENIRWNGKKVTYNLSKPNHKGQTSIQLDPIEFIDRIATLIPISHRHRRHYFGVFAPNSPLRKLVVANAKRYPENFVPPPLKLLSDKVHKASLAWAVLIARIYEVNPLICSKCGGKVKIVGFITHRIEILSLLQEMGWPLQFHEFDSPQPHSEEDNISQLLPNTLDGFPEIENQEWTIRSHWQNQNNDVPNKSCRLDKQQEAVFKENHLPLHWDTPESYCDPPHAEEVYIDPPHD